MDEENQVTLDCFATERFIEEEGDWVEGLDLEDTWELCHAPKY